MASRDPRVLLTASQSALLDFVRGGAAIVVLLGHVWGSLSDNQTFGRTYPWQSLGVVVFFWLSGFLIAYQCLVKRDYGFEQFYADRFSRIYVLLVPSLLLSAVLYGSVPQWRGASFGEWAANLLMVHHMPFGRVKDGLPSYPRLYDNAVLWTLMIEWWLYMAFGVVFFARRARGFMILLMLGLAVPAFLIVGYFVLKEYVAIMWFLGALCAFIFVRWREVDRASIALGFILAAAAFGIRFHLLSKGGTVNMYDLQLTFALAVALFFALLLARGWEGDGPRPRAYAVASGLAFISYALYLTHEPVCVAMVKHLGWADMSTVRAIALTVAALAVATLMALAFERRHLAVRRWLRRPSTPDRTGA